MLRLLIVPSTPRARDAYAAIIELASEAGFAVDFGDGDSETYDAVFLDCDGPFEPRRARAGGLTAFMFSAFSAETLDAIGLEFSRVIPELERYRRHPFGRVPPIRTYDTTLLAREGDGDPILARAPTDPLGVLVEPGVLVGRREVLTFSSINEDYRLCPSDQVTLERIHGAIRAAFQHLARTLSPRAPLRKTAWMDIGMFENDAALADQRRLIDWIGRARFDALWISIAPNQYYSKRGRYRARTDAMHRAVERFTGMLGEAAPRLIVSFHLANNFIAPAAQPERTAVDLWGTEYPDVPAPLDPSLWEEEVIAPVHALVERWPGSVPLSGFLIDLEMYNRHLTGVAQFLPSMGFEEETLARFGADRDAVEARLPEYFTWLEDQAAAIGARIRSEMRRALPECITACYAPAISLDWFYRGFYRGMSPLELFTFNARFQQHRARLEAANIHVHHSSVLMLSQVTRADDFSRVDAILREHDGIWINRLSRVADYEPGKWYSVETSPLSQEERIKFWDGFGAR